MQATIIDIIKPATSMANGLALPSSRVTSAGNPKMLFPIMELTTRAVIDQRPIERTKATETSVEKCRTPYHAWGKSAFVVKAGASVVQLAEEKKQTQVDLLSGFWQRSA